MKTLANAVVALMLLSSWSYIAAPQELKLGDRIDAARFALEACIFSDGLELIGYMMPPEEVRKRVAKICYDEILKYDRIANYQSSNRTIILFMSAYTSTLNQLLKQRKQ
jgi:hypothetical protein